MALQIKKSSNIFLHSFLHGIVAKYRYIQKLNLPPVNEINVEVADVPSYRDIYPIVILLIANSTALYKKKILVKIDKTFAHFLKDFICADSKFIG